MAETINSLYAEYSRLAAEFEKSIPHGNNEQLEWAMDKAFMKYVKALRATGFKVDMQAAIACVGRISHDG